MGLLQEILTKKNGYICKIGMPPSHPLFFRLILWNE